MRSFVWAHGLIISINSKIELTMKEANTLTINQKSTTLYSTSLFVVIICVWRIIRESLTPNQEKLSRECIPVTLYGMV